MRTIDPFRAYRLECTNEASQGFAFNRLRRGGSRTAPTGIQPHPMRSTTSWLHACYQRILPVEFPARGVIVDVLADLCKGILAAHHVFEVISLPQLTAGEPVGTIHPFRADGLECANQTPQRHAFACMRRGGSRTAPTGIQPHPMRSTTYWLHACYQRILPVEFPARRVIVDVLADLC